MFIYNPAYNDFMRIKRESWKNRGYVNVLRSNKGSLITWSKWTRKNNIKEATQFYKSRGTLRKDIKIVRTKLTNFVEVDTYGTKRVPGSAEKYQYFVKGTLIIGNFQKVIYASSQSHDKNYPVHKARDEAYQNFYYRVGNEVEGAYNDDVGELVIKSMDKRDYMIEEGIRYYKGINARKAET